MILSKLFIFDILVHITFLFIILFLFFFLVGLKKERDALTSSIESNTDKILLKYPQIQNFRQEYQKLQPIQKEILKKELMENMNQSKFQSSNNNNLFLALGIFIIIVLLSVTTYYGYYINLTKGVSKKKIIEVIFNTFILFVIICTIEVLFFFLVIMKYQPILNSDINKTFIDKYNQGLPSVLKNVVKSKSFKSLNS